ncbi:MAG: polyprenyl synthetase family protein [Kiritimatiellae bacterium]|nr:polyprenyl synthetase family protein [Kiritimatiellia bacterium]MDW8457824.1 polyprenyl synthetase family protein [Verrucomicrobiota bacterium]
MSTTNVIESGLKDTRQRISRALENTVLRKLTDDPAGLIAGGKMLRSRLIFHVGPAAGVPHTTLVSAAAAVELVHGASLLHDDVIDGGYLRRGAPTFWVERGIPAAILVGDMLLFKAVEVICEVEEGRLTPLLVKLTGEVCDAESEQELLLRGAPATLEACLRIARRKTGALFAFSAGVCGGFDPELTAALIESGYAAGTAYQLADDILDFNGSESESGKSLGSDEARGKTTVGALRPQEQSEAMALIDSLCRQSEELLRSWPSVYQAWRAFMDSDMRPALKKNLSVAVK